MFLTIVFLNYSSQRAKIHHSTNLAKKNLILTLTALLSLRLTITHFYTRQRASCLHDPVGKKLSKPVAPPDYTASGRNSNPCIHRVPLPQQPPPMCSPLTVGHLHGLQLGVWSPVEAFHLLLLQSFQ